MACFAVVVKTLLAKTFSVLEKTMHHQQDFLDTFSILMINSHPLIKFLRKEAHS